MEDNCRLWYEFNQNLIKGKYDKVVEMWDPCTRMIFAKDIKNFRKKQVSWKIIEFLGSSKGEIFIRYKKPRGIVAKLILAYNDYKQYGKKKLGKFISWVVDSLTRCRKKGIGFFPSLSGVFLHKINVLSREYSSNEIIKKYAVIEKANNKYLGWSYSTKNNSNEYKHKYEFDTFIFYSYKNYSIHLLSLKKLDYDIKDIIEKLNLSLPKINVFFLNVRDSNTPKDNFVNPHSGDIYLHGIRVQYDVLKHEIFHAIIYLATSSWPSQFFREGYAESYKEITKESLKILTNKYPVTFLLRESSFFDASKIPPIISGIMVRYLIEKYGLKKFYDVYKKANGISTKKVLKQEYRLNIFSLKKEIIKFYDNDIVQNNM